MTGPSDPEVIRELRARVAAAVPAMSLDEAAVRAAGHRRVSQRRWAAGGSAVAAAMLLAVVVTTSGWLPVSNGIGLAGDTGQTPCVTAPSVEYRAPGQSVAPLPQGATVTVTAQVGEPVTVHFVGACAAGGRLMINDSGSSGADGFTDLWSGEITGSWTPAEPGPRTLLAAWACSGPKPCPLATLGYITVITGGPRPLDPQPSSEVTPGQTPAASPDLEALAPGEWHLTAGPDVGDADRALASALLTFALDPKAAPDALAFAPTVALGSGATIERSVPADQLRDLAAWDVAPGGGYERNGPFNALEILAARIGGTDDYGVNGGKYGGRLSVSLGAHPGCPYTQVDVPTEYATAAQVWISPADGAIDSCIDWFAVNLFVDGGAVGAVTVQLGSP